MKRMKQTMVSLVLTVLLAVTPAALAAASVSAADVAAARITFSEAITVASDAYPGLKLLSLSLDDENGTPVYQAELYNPADGSCTVLSIDGLSGQALTQSADTDDVQDENQDEGNNQQDEGNKQDEQEMEAENDSNNESENGHEDAALIQDAVLTVAQAQALVLKANPGASVTEIELQNENGTPVFGAAFIDSGGQTQTVKIDAVTGAFLPEDMQSENE
jgi:uncharacterized membrane protein YkoI